MLRKECLAATPPTLMSVFTFTGCPSIRKETTNIAKYKKTKKKNTLKSLKEYF
jgi:hypothetical protein